MIQSPLSPFEETTSYGQEMDSWQFMLLFVLIS
jgi:hypothetical protein